MSQTVIEVGNVFTKVNLTVLSSDVIDQIQTKMSYIVPGYKFTPTYKKTQNWDGTKTVAKRVGSTIQMPTGLLSYLREILGANGIDYKIIDQRKQSTQTPGYSYVGFTPYDYQEPIIANIINKQRGVVKMATGCHVKDQGILMFDRTIKLVQDIKIGDTLMGPDKKARHVQKLYRGHGKIFEIKRINKKSFLVNEDHILTLSSPGNEQLVDITVKDWKKSDNSFKKYYYSFQIDLDTGDVSRAKFEANPVQDDDFYGFKLNGDGRYLLDDCTVTHNSGKTEVAIAAAVGASVFPFIFYVPSCDLLEQAYTRFTKCVRKNGIEETIGRVGAGHFDLQPITIMTIQSAQNAIEGKFTKFDDESDDDDMELDQNQKSKIKEFIHEAQFVACDEAHHTSAQTVQSILNNSFSARYRVGFSASPWRDDGLDILIEACFGKKLCDINASFLINRGFLIRPQITFNHLKQVLSPCATYQEYYKHYVVENDFRNRWIAKTAIEHVSLGRMTIILVKWVRHAEILADLIPGSEILSSSGEFKKSPAKRKKILERMKNKELMCAIGTSLLDEGVDVPAATTGIFAGGGKSSTRALQRVGRFIRKDKNDITKDLAYIEEIHDHCMFMNHHAQIRKKILLTEPEFKLLDNRINCDKL